MNPPQSTRRALVRGAAWTVPAISLVAAAPAYADSVPKIVFNPGATGAVESDGWFDLAFSGASVQASGNGGSAVLTMTVTFAPFTGAESSMFSYQTWPSSWNLASTASEATQFVFTYAGSFGSGSNAPIENGAYFGTANQQQRGTFNLNFTAPGYTSANQGFSTPASRSAGPRQPESSVRRRPTG